MRLTKYFQETKAHIELINEALDVLKDMLPIKNYQELDNLEKFALNALIFRFSKLQDLLGSKIFRTYLEFTGFNTSDKSFFDILKEIEKEGIVDIDTWDELRKFRNQIAHDYPLDKDEVIESINLFVQKSKELIRISQKLEEKYLEIKQQRDRDN